METQVQRYFKYRREYPNLTPVECWHLAMITLEALEVMEE